jgi:hypothetical protein
VFSPALAGEAGFSWCGTGFSLSSFSRRFFLRRFHAFFRWFFFFLLFHASMMSDLSVDVVDAHDAVVSKGHPISSKRVSLQNKHTEIQPFITANKTKEN